MYILTDEQAKAIHDAIEKYGKRSVLYINGIAHTIEEGLVGVLLSAKKVDTASPTPVDPAWVMKLVEACVELPELEVASAEPEIDVDGLRALLKAAEAERDAALLRVKEMRMERDAAIDALVAERAVQTARLREQLRKVYENLGAL
jgi:hypothetical protein